jgi:hypothetical protein
VTLLFFRSQLCYEFRGQLYEINLLADSASITVGKCTIRSPLPFAASATGTGLQFFRGTESDWALSFSPPQGLDLTVDIENWPGTSGASREWTESASQNGGRIPHILKGLTPNAVYQLYVDGHSASSLRTDKHGQVAFNWKLVSAGKHRLKISLRK